jgi:transcriptional regulator with XRE-family HTH domain
MSGKGLRTPTANPDEMQIVPLHDHGAERSPLASSRLRRQLTLPEAARRAGISEDEASWLEEGRVYRFPSTDAAMLALLLYATALGIDHREAKELAGLPVPPVPFKPGTRARIAVVAAIAALLAALLTAVAFSQLGDTGTLKPLPPVRTLPPAWKVNVDVYSGAHNVVPTRAIASKIQALGYSIRHVKRAPQQNYAHTLVYYEAGGAPVAARLAKQLGTTTAPLPGGSNARRLVVIVGRR